MLFQNIAMLDDSFQIQENCYVGTHEDRIAYIGTEVPREDYGTPYEGRGKLLMPGFYNAHSHLPMILMRGYGENLTLNDWLFQKIFPFEDRFQPQDIYYATLLSIAEMLRFGIVSTSDTYFFCENMAQAIMASGVKANLSRSVSCFDGSSYYDLLGYRDIVFLLEEYQDAGEGRLKIEFGIHAEYTATDRLVREVVEFMQGKNAGMHLHLSETKKEHEECKLRHQGLSPAQYFHSMGVFDSPTIAAHCIHLDDGDYDILKEKNVSVATCPKSNLKLASGICDVKRLLEKGINVALGTDGVASNNNLNMLEEIKMMVLLQKVYNNDPTLITPKEALYAATVAGAKAQGRSDCGLLRAGNKADLIVLDISAPYMQPPSYLINHLIYSACGTDVVLTMVDGKVLYQNGEYTTLDVEKAAYEVGCSQKRILSEL